MFFFKLVSRDITNMPQVRIDKENVGQLASTLVAALTSKSTRFKSRSDSVATALRAGTTWSVDGVLVGIQDFIIMAESGNLVRCPIHVDLTREVCLSGSTLEAMDEVALTMTIAHYTRLVLDSVHYQKNAEHIAARERIRNLIADAVPMIFIRGVEHV